MIEPEQYADVEVAGGRYKVGTHMGIIEDLEYECNRNTKEYSSTVGGCKQEQNQVSRIVTVYVLLDEFKAYDPLVVVKRTPRNICRCGKEERSIIHAGWTVWELPHPQHWEMPPRNDNNRAKRREQFPCVAEAH